jgi:hypothetical protein
MSEPSRERERAARIRQSRQVIAGPDIDAPTEPLVSSQHESPLAPPIVWYFIALAVLVVLSAVLWAVWGMGAATLPLLLLIIGLFLAWFIL